MIHSISKTWRDNRYLNKLHRVLHYLSGYSKVFEFFDSVLFYSGKINVNRDYEILNNSICSYSGKYIYLLPYIIEWNVPLFQRPQHIAMALSEMGRLYFYCTCGTNDDITEPKYVNDKCIVVNQNRIDLIFRLAAKYGKRIVIDLYSTTNKYDQKWINKYRKLNAVVLYEYIDELSSDISGRRIPESIKNRHRVLLEDNTVYVVSTAEKLQKDVISYRGNDRNTLLSGNGVDVKHFSQQSKIYSIPVEVQGIITDKRPIVGYFGAIAPWFDFDLVVEAAKNRPEYKFVLIGPQYGRYLPHINLLKDADNIVWTGALDYELLPFVAQKFTITTIPFKLNDVTESTSPIKLFEYMAMGKPIVTTAMRECKKYPEVMIANNVTEYITLIDKAINITQGCNYKQYSKRLITIANDNSWHQKAKEITDLVERDDSENNNREQYD